MREMVQGLKRVARVMQLKSEDADEDSTPCSEELSGI